MSLIIVERDYFLPADIRDQYIGVPCQSYEEVNELIAAHTSCWNDTETVTEQVADGINVLEVLKETGEPLKMFLVRTI